MTPTNEGQSELRPCPFCGSIEIANHRSGYVYCMECEASGPIAYGEPNGAPWNRRTPDQSLAQKDAELAALRTQDAYDNEAIERMQREGARLEVEAAQKDVRITELEAESEGAYEAIHDANGSTAEGGLALAIKRMAELSGAEVPPEVVARINAVSDDDEAVKREGIAIATELCNDLLAYGVPGIHFITMNTSTATREIYKNLGLA